MNMGVFIHCSNTPLAHHQVASTRLENNGLNANVLRMSASPGLRHQVLISTLCGVEIITALWLCVEDECEGRGWPVQEVDGLR